MTSTTIDLNKIMGLVQGLLAKADSSEFPEEADSCRSKAEQLMRDYRIAEEQLIATDQVEIMPEVHELWLGPAVDLTRKGGNGFYQEWYAIARQAGLHAGIQTYYRFKDNPETGQYGIWAVFVGYAGDLRLAELITTNARIVFGERVEPKPDPDLSDRENAYRLRAAGITRDRAAKMIWGETSHARAAQVGKWYKEVCAERGEVPALDGRGIQASLYRDQFAQAFVIELGLRLQRARDAADSVGGAMVLHGRKERVLEAFYNEFPNLRPVPRTEVAVKDNAPATRKGRQPKPYWDTAAGKRAMERESSDTARAARTAGRGAAADVPLDRTAPAGRVSPAPRTASGAIEG